MTLLGLSVEALVAVWVLVPSAALAAFGTVATARREAGARGQHID